ncbi:MAG TPA: NUMOD4 domain-containing protein [Ohtaekwangia sp.]|uniref:NUMOD4 domain-containing protein n=1 Tax=Ohtaekwangia sp. TaxID=2066019 RepID=UPI002F950F44
MDTKGNFPYQNTSLVSLPKEKWKDIPGFEGLYRISNYGRVKSVPRERVMNSPHGGVYMSKEMIRKSKLDVKLNKTIGQNLYTLLITLYKEGRIYHFSVARLVYYTFGKAFDLDDHSIYISYNDHDGRNVHISNLVKTDIQTIKLLSYEKGRAVSHLSVLSKPVTQFDTQGNPVESYPSMYEAGKRTGLNERNIAAVVSGSDHMYKGFFWKAGIHKRKLDLSKISRNAEQDMINVGLKKRLGLKKVDLANPPAYLNLSTQSMKGERWHDVPGYKGLYQVSSVGRVKALKKISEGKQQKWMPERIQRLTIDFRLGPKGKEIPGSAFACMASNGVKKLISVPRLVYFLFVKKFDITDSTLRVYYKDGNSLNLHHSNLMLKRGVWSFKKVRERK